MRLFFDMDNTLADFDGNGGLDRMHEKGFFRNLKPYANVVDTMKALYTANLPIFILSACIDTEYCRTEKIEWLAEYLPFIPKENIILVNVGESKAKAIGGTLTTTDVLFDDYKVNLNTWVESGGTAVKCGKVYKKDRNYKQVIEFVGIADILATL